MGLGPIRPVFTQRWQDRYAPTAERTMNCTVRIYDPNTSQAIYDKATGAYASTPTILYEGPARLQPLRYAKLDSDTSVRDMNVELPIGLTKNLVIRPWHRGKIVSSPLIPALEGYLYTVKDALSNGNPITRLVTFQVNQETAAQ